MRSLLALVFLLPMLAHGQSGEPRIMSISNFAGLNTAASDMVRRPNESIVDINLDHSRYGVGSFGKRWGYDSVSYLAGQDECIGLDAIYLSDYRQYLGSVWDSAGVGYGGIYVSPYGESYFTGTQWHRFVPNVHNNYTYVDSFFFSGDTVVISYTSDADATLGEIVANFAYNGELIDTTTGLDGNFNPGVYTGMHRVILGYYAMEAVEFLGSTVATDTAQTDTIITDYTGKVWDYFSVQNRPSFAQFNDEWFIVNGAQKGVRYNGTIARSWPPNAPGEPTIVPLSDTGAMNGEYVYTFRASSSKSADSLMSSGYVSAPIRVRNGQVMLKDFIWPAADTTDTGQDTIMIFGYRSPANPGRIDEGDYAFFFDTIAVATSAATLAAVVYIDSIADDGLSTTDSVKLIHTDWAGRDPTGAIDVRYGAPGFLDIPTWADNGIFVGILDQTDTVGVAYRVTAMDTINGDESDGSPLSYVWVDSDSTGNGKKKPAGIQVALPSLYDTALVYNLYRAHILEAVSDSSILTFWDIYFDNFWFVPDNIRAWVNYHAIDTVILGEFRLVAQIPAADSTYTDTTSYASLLLQPVFRGAIPPLLSGVFSHDEYLWGWDGSILAWSDIDSVGNWGAFSREPISPNDGDAIVVCFADRFGIRILKNYTNYRLHDVYSKVEKVGDWGCIAPHSYAAADNGHFYLSARGVVFESEGMQLERSVNQGLISTKLRNFDVMSIETKRTAVGVWNPVEGRYLLCIGDTTYVYDKRASDLQGEEVWGQWVGLTFEDACLYNTEDELGFVPGDDFYFIQDGSSNLFLYGSSETDPRSTKILIEWENANMLVDPGLKSELMAVGIRGYSDNMSDTLWVRPIDETGTATVANVVIDSLNQYYRVVAFGKNMALEHGIEIRSLGAYSFESGQVDRIDIWYEPRIEPIMIR